MGVCRRGMGRLVFVGGKEAGREGLRVGYKYMTLVQRLMGEMCDNQHTEHQV